MRNWIPSTYLVQQAPRFPCRDCLEKGTFVFPTYTTPQVCTLFVHLCLCALLCAAIQAGQLSRAFVFFPFVLIMRGRSHERRPVDACGSSLPGLVDWR